MISIHCQTLNHHHSVIVYTIFNNPTDPCSREVSEMLNNLSNFFILENPQILIMPSKGKTKIHKKYYGMKTLAKEQSTVRMYSVLYPLASPSCPALPWTSLTGRPCQHSPSPCQRLGSLGVTAWLSGHASAFSTTPCSWSSQGQQGCRGQS